MPRDVDEAGRYDQHAYSDVLGALESCPRASGPAILSSNRHAEDGPMKKKIGDTSKAFHEFQGFVKRLLAVPKEELQAKLDAEKKNRKRQPRQR